MNGGVNIMENKQSLDFIKSLLNGEKVKCPKCNEGIFKSDTEPAKSHYFYCTHCDNTVNIN